MQAAEGGDAGGQVKAHLRASQELLVESLYNVAPLLDHALAAGLLSQENYYEVQAEATPPRRARRLLEVVQAQMDEDQALCFLQCLRSCHKHYPRLRSWLCSNTDIKRGPTELRLQAQSAVLCARLGSLVLPVSLQLFSGGSLTQFELEQLQAEPTPYQQTHRLLRSCLSKGESACVCFYQALCSQDAQLAADIDAETQSQAEHCATRVSSRSDTLPSVAGLTEEPISSFPVEESTAGANLPHTGVLQQVAARLGVAGDAGAGLNMCELGVALGLPRWAVRDCLLEEAGLADSAQLVALVTLFLEKTQDVPRLLSRVAECDPQRVRLSERGRLLLELLKEAELLLQGGARDRAWPIFSFLAWECVAEAVEEPGPGPGSRAWAWGGALRLLRGSERVEPELLQELEELWAEGGAESLLQSVRALGQLLRDLHPLHDGLHISPPQEGALYACRPRRLHRVTRFPGLSARVIRRALTASSAPAPAPPPAPPALPHCPYRQVCLSIVRLAHLIQPEGGGGDLSHAPTASVTCHARALLSGWGFRGDTFDVGLRCRVEAVLEWDPVRLGLPALFPLHRDTLAQLERYLRPSERHAFQLYPDAVRVLGGGAELCWAASVRGPVAIDGGLEEGFAFGTSAPASLLIRLRCRGYEGGEPFQVSEPGCVQVCGLGEEGVAQAQREGALLLAAEGGAVWLREGPSRDRLRSLMQKHSVQVQDAGCCFRVSSSATQCEVKFVYRNRKLSARAERSCEVL
ncbi:uncharacterized protein LOC118772363 [Megalops cyprinoides]|uniref:uncharacterized protein LOC118772363 n=1 Tax=Megalops cyprinoides TaxID=118141 RepID=UPI0018653EE4|nr:uncharacterized protein LOC118772363 [Megalops cyprinoides]